MVWYCLIQNIFLHAGHVFVQSLKARIQFILLLTNPFALYKVYLLPTIGISITFILPINSLKPCIYLMLVLHKLFIPFLSSIFLTVLKSPTKHHALLPSFSLHFNIPCHVLRRIHINNINLGFVMTLESLMMCLDRVF